MKKAQKLMKASIVSLFVSSFSMLLSFFGSFDGNAVNLFFSYATGVLFWGGLIAGYVLLAMVNKIRKEDEKRNPPKRVWQRKKPLPGALCFFSNIYAFIFDISAVLFLILTVVFSFISVLNGSLLLISLAFLVFSIHMHCILNGVNFKYTKSEKYGKDD